MNGILPALVVALLLASACEPAPDVEPPPCKNPQAGLLTLGEGDLGTGFVPVAEGTAMTVVLGPQGLHMLVLSARIEGYEWPLGDRQPTRIEAAMRLDGEVIGGVVDHVAPSLSADGHAEVLGLWAIFRLEYDEYIGKMADVSVMVEDGCRRRLVDTRHVRLVQTAAVSGGDGDGSDGGVR